MSDPLSPLQCPVGKSTFWMIDQWIQTLNGWIFGPRALDIPLFYSPQLANAPDAVYHAG